MAREKANSLDTARPNTSTLSEQIYQWLKKRITIGELHPGQRIDLDAVAAEMDVSRMPVRDALNRLASEGLVSARRRHGTIVTETSPDEIAEIGYLRRIVEVAVAGDVAQNASQGLIADLEAIQTQLDALDRTAIYRDYALYSRYTELNSAFHRRIAGELGNRQIDRLSDTVSVIPLVGSAIFSSDPSALTDRMAEHHRILAAFWTRDAAAARDAMNAHHLNSRQDFIRLSASHFEGKPDSSSSGG